MKLLNQNGQLLQTSEGMTRFLKLAFALLLVLTNCLIMAQRNKIIDWSVAATLPSVDGKTANIGIAGAFSGISNDAMIIAGGANFPDAMPWNGGKKVYYNGLYVLKKTGKKNFSWYVKDKFHIEDSIAYGASVSSDSGIICIGGESTHGISDKVFSILWNKAGKTPIKKNLAPLPFPLCNAAAVVVKNIVYVAGGETTGSVSDRFICLDLANTSAEWKELPALPFPVSHAVIAMQSNGIDDCIYLIGGRQRKTDGVSELYNTVYEFNLRTNRWAKKQSLPHTLSAGTSLSVGSNRILLFGGDKGETFHKVEELIAAISQENDVVKKQQLVQKKNQLQVSHPGFSDEVLCYCPKTDEWTTVGRIPFSVPVTTTAVNWNGYCFIPSGEIKAGVRTSQILMGKLPQK